MLNIQSKANWAVCIICGLATLSTGCRTTSHAEGGALAGAGLGGTMGALIGSQSGRGGTGAVLGAMTGAMIGGLAGEAEDAREQHDAAVAHAQYERDMAARQQSITNYDLITMAQAGLSDQVVLNAVQTRGGQFDLSPSAIIELKSRGVSENVILSIQRSSENGSTRASTAAYSQPTATVVAPPAVYIVRPTPRIGFYYGPRPHGPYYRSHRHCW